MAFTMKNSDFVNISYDMYGRVVLKRLSLKEV